MRQTSSQPSKHNHGGRWEPFADDDGAEWAIALRRADVVRRLLSADGSAGRSKLIAAAAVELAVSRATVYRLLARFRKTEVTSAILPARRGRPQGRRSLDGRREAIITREISGFYLKPQRPRLSHLIEMVL